MSLLPHSSQAELALLGMLMLENRHVECVEDKLKPEHFFSQLHAACYRKIVELVADGSEANPITLHQRLQGTEFGAQEDLFPHVTSMFEAASLGTSAWSFGRVI